MDKAKPMGKTLASHFRLSKDWLPKLEKEHDYMIKISYALAIGSLMYAMVNMRLDFAHWVRVVSRYMSNLKKKQH